jgi:hypothetical protein
MAEREKLIIRRPTSRQEAGRLGRRVYIAPLVTRVVVALKMKSVGELERKP